MSDDRKVLIVGGAQQLGAAQLAALSLLGPVCQPIVIEDEHRLNIGDYIALYDDRPRDRMGFYHDRPVARARPEYRGPMAVYHGLPATPATAHTFTDAPLTKRQRRRLRGKTHPTPTTETADV